MADPHDQATFYHYRLIKKIPLTRKLTMLYLGLPGLVAIAAGMLISVYTLIYFVLALPIMIWIHYVIGHTMLTLLGSVYRRRWRFRLQLSWLGFAPHQHASRRVFTKVQLYTSSIGFLLCAIMAFLLPWPFTLSLVFWHVWLHLPWSYILLRLTGLRKDGMLKMNEQDMSYYLQ
ncbi:hypothetical protein JCM10914A_19770 [Paenibacillus sp. JCM 10914]|uniref:hypothetical protein n=1 Tax=Paenibacillus sp. JCM 10914 TaxID=1236974 RepID=UPI0003CC5931|nr:hypothetical protein [Paenibacillus sp. JCM 10914]GAE10057.1 hypothetical protein JCM10914_6461 [Paenibacillus sp. JCM 10914]